MECGIPFPHCFSLEKENYTVFSQTKINTYTTMKAIFLRISTVLLFLVASAGMALAEVKEIVLVKTPYEHIDDYPIGDRMPSRPILCTISEDGIFVDGYDVGNILSYEAYDMNGTCLFVTDDSQKFGSFILSNSDVNEYEIRFIVLGYMLKGYI